ncbi:MAG: hypothetical protein EXR69_04655 [Myxococcales bacterium]|nr:hypothetical protein [Myxococcales bacterium]
MLTLTLLLAGGWSALADTPDRPWLFTRVAIAGGLFPDGAQLDARVQARMPLYTTQSFLLADNYAGIGLRATVTPAFLTVGPRLSIAPVAFFDIDVSANVQRYFRTPFGPLPFDQIDSGKAGDARNARAGESFAATSMMAAAEPTLKVQAGPIVAFDAWVLELRHTPRPADQSAPFVYEPFWDLVVAWDDLIIEQQGAVLAMIWKGDEGAKKLWIGATARHHWAVQSTDASLVVGGVLLASPGKSFLGGPQLVLQVLPYVLDDDDIQPGPPNIQAQIGWDIDTPFRR